MTKRDRPWFGKVGNGIRNALPLPGRTSFIISRIHPALRLDRKCWKKGLAAALLFGVLYKTWGALHGTSSMMTVAGMCAAALFSAPFIAIFLSSRRPWLWILAFSLLFGGLYYGVPFALKSGTEKFAEKSSPDGRFVVEYYDVETGVLAGLLYNHAGSYFVKVLDRETNRYVYESDLTDWRCETMLLWPIEPDRHVYIGVGDACIEFDVPD